jgi:3-(3-hydroxy-phenyl)propionate hydroxylase
MGGDTDGEPERFVTPQPTLGPGVHDGSDYGGKIAEQPFLGDGVRLDDAVGYAPCLLLRRDVKTATNGQADQADDVTRVVATAGAARDWLDRLDCFAVLIRPDRYIFGVAGSESELPDLIERFRASRQTQKVAHASAPHPIAQTMTVSNKDLP